MFQKVDTGVSVSMRKVAAYAGVSPATVSRVLSESPDSAVTEETRERVYRAIRELNYQRIPPALAREALPRRTPSQETRRLGFIAPPVQRSMHAAFFQAQFQGVMQAAMQRRCNIYLFTGATLHEMDAIVEDVQQGCCGGLLISYQPPDRDGLSRLFETGIPFVLLNQPHPESRFHCVDVDNCAAARRMTDYLLDLGHRKIALFTHRTDDFYVPLRIEGYHQAFRERQVALDESLIVTGLRGWTADVEAAVMALMARPAESRPTAIFCTADELAVMAVSALQRKGIAVPQQVSVAGFNGDNSLDRVYPSITTIQQPFERTAGEAMDLLRQQVIAPAAQGVKLLMPTELVVRESTGPPMQVLD